MSRRVKLVLMAVAAVVVVVAVGGLAVLGGVRSTSGREEAFEDRDRARAENDRLAGERDELRREADRLSKLIGLPVELGKPTTTLDQVEDFGDRDFFEDYRATPFGMVGLIHGFAFRIVSVERVKEGRRTWDETDARKRLPPIKPLRGDIHYVRIVLDVINRSGGTGDPACGMVGELEIARVVWVDNEKARGRGVEAPFSDGTYEGACGRGIPDGARGRIEVYWGVLGDEPRILALDPGFSGDPRRNPIARAREKDELTLGERPTELLLLFPKPT